MITGSCAPKRAGYSNFDTDKFTSWPHQLLGPKVFNDKELVEVLYAVYHFNKTTLKEYIEESQKRIISWKFYLNQLYSQLARFNDPIQLESMYKAYLKRYEKLNNKLETIKMNVVSNQNRLKKLIQNSLELQKYEVGLLDKPYIRVNYSFPTLQQWKTGELSKIKQSIKQYEQYIKEEYRRIKEHSEILKNLIKKI